MSNIALYRKYRPKNFDEIFGQSAIVQTLRNQVKYGRIGHAYLFCGLRGSGKTSIARIFANAVNCENTVNGNPCGRCHQCTSEETQMLNIIEIDAASNNGVDNIRQLIDEVNYKPANGAKYKIYIIDEVHMLTASAFNALLKTLEEPPAHAIFILATTELYKVPVTIRSRCQVYTFKFLTIEEIKGSLKYILEQENNTLFSDDCLDFIANKADGSIRDAVSILDQCIIFANNNPMTVDKIIELFGDIQKEVVEHMASCIRIKDLQGALNDLYDQYYNGKNIKMLFNDLYRYYFNQVANDNVDLLYVERYIRILAEVVSQIDKLSNTLVSAEITIARMCEPEMDFDRNVMKSITSRMDEVESQLCLLMEDEKVENNVVSQANQIDYNSIVYYNDVNNHVVNIL